MDIGVLGEHAQDKVYARLAKLKLNLVEIVEHKAEHAKVTANGQQVGEVALEKVLAIPSKQILQAALHARLKYAKLIANGVHAQALALARLAQLNAQLMTDIKHAQYALG